MASEEILYYVCDLLTGAIVEGEFPFQRFGYARGKNVPGGWSANVSHRHARNRDDLLAPWTKACFATRKNQVLGGGMITSRNTTLDGGMLVGGMGFFEGYREKRRLINSRLGMTHATGANSLEITFTAIDQLNIALDLMEHAAAFGGAADIGYDAIGLNGPGVGGISNVPRDRTYWSYELKGIGEAIEELAAMSNGFDFAESYYWDVNRIGRRLDLYYPYKTGSTNLEFELGRNVLLLNRDENGERLTTRYTARGSGQDDAQMFSQATEVSLEVPTGVYPLLEGYDDFSDLSEQDLLDAIAARNLVALRQPFDTIELQVKEDAEVLIGSFDWGDEVRVSANDGALQVNALYRIEQYTVEINENGAVELKPTVTLFPASTGIA